jgi:hypothetical protein
MRNLVVRTSYALVLAAFVSPAASQTILGGRFDLKEKPGFPLTRKLTIKAAEKISAESLAGDPATNGAIVQVIVNGTTSTSQTMVLPAGVRWKRSPADTNLPATRWRYRDSRILGYVSPLLKLDISSKGVNLPFKVAAQFAGKYAALNIGVPNTGTYAGMVFILGGVGAYCTNFGGVAGGTFARNDAFSLRIAKPTAEGTCPSGTAVCGDNQVDAPFETCDGTNDAACPGLCGANGLACLCPFCGDATIDPGESCDTNGNLGSCTEGCSYACACTTCGNGTVETPVEDCEPSLPDQCAEGSCGSVGNPGQCRCPYCGDDIVNLPAEQCDGTDDSSCPGGCLVDCTCAVCGDNATQGAEQCDGTDDGACPGSCQLDCTCP